MADITKINLKGTELNIRDAGAARSSELADVATSGSYNDLSNKPTIPTVDSTLTQGGTNPVQGGAIYTALAGKADANTIPTKVSELTNDSAFVTANDLGNIVVASGELEIIETSNYIDVFIYVAEINSTTSSLALYAAQKSATIKVSGRRLKNDISITVPSGFTASPSTIAHSNGTVAETNVEITYTGADDSSASGEIVLNSGSITKSIPLVYTQYNGPTIVTSANSLEINAGPGSTNSKSVAVNGFNLEGAISAAISGTDSAKFSVVPATLSKSGGSASGSFTVTYSPASGDSGVHSATLTFASANATTVSVQLTGAVSELTLSTNSISMTAEKNSSSTSTFTVEGANLSGDISIAVSGTGLSTDINSITAVSGAVTSTTVTVTFAPTSTGVVNGSITVGDGVTSKTISVVATATGAKVIYNKNTDSSTYIEWEVGTINNSTGLDSEGSTSRARTVDYLPCANTLTFTRSWGNVTVMFYDDNHTYKGYEWFANSHSCNVPSGATCFRVSSSNKELTDIAKQYTTGGPWLTHDTKNEMGFFTTYEPN